MRRLYGSRADFGRWPTSSSRRTSRPAIAVSRHRLTVRNHYRLPAMHFGPRRPRPAAGRALGYRSPIRSPPCTGDRRADRTASPDRAAGRRMSASRARSSQTIARGLSAAALRRANTAASPQPRWQQRPRLTHHLSRRSPSRGSSLRAYAAASASNSGLPSVPPISGSTRSSGCGISPSTRRLGDRMPAMLRALPLRLASGVISPEGDV